MLKLTYPNKTLLYILVCILPKSYIPIIDGFRTNQSLSINKKLKILYKKKKDKKKVLVWVWICVCTQVASGIKS